MRRLAALTAALLLIAAPAASALPGDALIVPLTPADGAALPVNPDGIEVTFSCPVYGVFLSGDFAFPGGPKDYGVSFATSSALSADGRLADPVALPQAASTGGDGCAAFMNPGGSPPRPQDTPGRYYWQPWRLCAGCSPSYETGPVRSFTLTADATVRVGSPGRVYAGYPALVPVTVSGNAAGARVTLQRKAGKSWRGVGSASVVGGRAEPLVKLPRGDQQLRAVVKVGSQAVASPERRVTVARAAAWSTGAGDDGAYKGSLGGERSVRFTVTGGGRAITGFTAFVAMTCPSVTPGQFTTQIGTAKLGRMKVAPDGRFVAAATPDGRTAISARGKLRNGRVTGGRVTLSLGPCTGSTSFGATK